MAMTHITDPGRRSTSTILCPPGFPCRSSPFSIIVIACSMLQLSMDPYIAIVLTAAALVSVPLASFCVLLRRRNTRAADPKGVWVAIPAAVCHGMPGDLSALPSSAPAPASSAVQKPLRILLPSAPFLDSMVKLQRRRAQEFQLRWRDAKGHVRRQWLARSARDRVQLLQRACREVYRGVAPYVDGSLPLFRTLLPDMDPARVLHCDHGQTRLLALLDALCGKRVPNPAPTLPLAVVTRCVDMVSGQLAEETARAALVQGEQEAAAGIEAAGTEAATGNMAAKVGSSMPMAAANVANESSSAPSPPAPASPPPPAQLFLPTFRALCLLSFGLYVVDQLDAATPLRKAREARERAQATAAQEKPRRPIVQALTSIAFMVAAMFGL